MAASASRKKSPIWEYFQLTEDTKYASCMSCDKLISQGGDSMKVYNATNRLKSTHNEAYKECQQKYTEHQENDKKKKQEKELSTSKVLSLMEV